MHSTLYYAFPASEILLYIVLVVSILQALDHSFQHFYLFMSFCRNTYHLRYTVSSPYHLDTLYHPLITSVEYMATYLLFIFPCIYYWYTKSLQYHCQCIVSPDHLWYMLSSSSCPFCPRWIISFSRCMRFSSTFAACAGWLRWWSLIRSLYSWNVNWQPFSAMVDRMSWKT